MFGYLDLKWLHFPESQLQYNLKVIIMVNQLSTIKSKTLFYIEHRGERLWLNCSNCVKCLHTKHCGVVIVRQ